MTRNNYRPGIYVRIGIIEESIKLWESYRDKASIGGITKETLNKHECLLCRYSVYCTDCTLFRVEDACLNNSSWDKFLTSIKNEDKEGIKNAIDSMLISLNKGKVLLIKEKEKENEPS